MSCPSRVELRQCLPRALFADSAIVAATKALRTGSTRKSGGISSPDPSERTTVKQADSHKHDSQQPNVQLVLITCPRSRRKNHTPAKLVSTQRGSRKTPKSRNPSGGEGHRHSSRHSKRNTDTNSTHGSLSMSQPAVPLDMSDYFSRTNTSLSSKSTVDKRRHRRSVHETPDPEKSYPRWERAKLAAAEKTKGRVSCPGRQQFLKFI
ncbi:unnamed protein product [Echinostoma caproni]|uniref:Uncharacterized protein n=1 Tax=Echinostoma caproni TaxID=27848 RepID=A0A3P8B8S5_9TREM|nr:unnamed protein product [Echinostoma caproni]